MKLSQQIFNTITKHKLIKPSDTIIVGVSGGADSVVLLHILYQLRHRLGIRLHVAHLNHRLRPSADRDEAFVKELADQMHLPITILRRMKPLKSVVISEDHSRQWRFNFFSKLLRKINAQSIVLAHTQNDLAETVLMRFLRGSGLLGLRGILTENRLQGVRVIRPFLSVQRKQIEKYLKTYKVKFQTDETNQQINYLRNKIRLKLLPNLIKEYNNNLPNVLVDVALTVGEDYDYILNQASRFLRKNANVNKTKVSIPVKVLLKQPVAIQRMFLRLSFEHLVSDFLQLNFSHIKEVEDMLLTRPQGSSVHWPKFVQVAFVKNILVISVQN